MRGPGRIAVIGGGPAGAMAAAELAAAGRDVLLLDEKLAWEKPCGGGITQKALDQYPFLSHAQVERNWIRGCELTSPSGYRASFVLNRRIAIFSRQVLNRLLLERAAAGAQIVRERVTSVEGTAGAWQLRARRAAFSAEYLVIAGGARSKFRGQLSRPFAPADLLATAGYFIPGSGDTLEIAFLKGIEGYIWVFPRSHHLSAGICARLQTATTASLRTQLDAFLAARGYDLSKAQFYSHVLPAPTAGTLQKAPLEGMGWALVGDAAGLVDAITGEGLYYAIRSADLLAQALTQARSYTQLLERELLPELRMAARMAGRFYHGNFLGQAVLERVVRLTDASATLRELTRDLFAGSQGYRGLRRRFYLSLPRVAMEMLFAPAPKSSVPASPSLESGKRASAAELRHRA